MKKTTRRWSAFCLAVMLILSVAVVASAASLTFSQLGKTWTAAVNRNGRNDAIYMVNGCGMYAHEKGTASQVFFHGNYSAEHAASYSEIPSAYESYIWQLFEQESLQLTDSASGNSYHQWYDVEAEKPSGYYRMAVVFRCFNARWSVTEGISAASIDPAAVIDASSGTFTQAPTDVWEFKPVLEDGV